MKIKILVLGLIAILFAGCSGMRELSRSYHVKTYVDEFENYEEHRQRYNRNPAGIFVGLVEMDALDLRIRKYSTGRKEYSIIVYVERPNWLYIQRVPFELKVDNKIFEFLFLNHQSHVLEANKVQEWAYYKTDIESINEIMEAEKVIGKLYGDDGFIIIEYRPAVFERWKEFLEKYDKEILND